MKFLVIALGVFLLNQTASASSVVVTIKPIHSLVQNILGDTAKAQLLIDFNVSPHDFQLKPSQLKTLRKADLVFYIDISLEGFMNKVLDILPDNVLTVPLLKQHGLKLLEQRQYDHWEAYDKNYDNVLAVQRTKELNHDGKMQARYDPHIWLNPENSRIMSAAITDKLSQIYPENANQYHENYLTLVEKIDQLDSILRRQLANSSQLPFIVLHDAYQYFEKHYNLAVVGSVMPESGLPPSIKHIQDLHQRISTYNVMCIFYQPQVSDKLVNNIISISKINSNTLDPTGAGLMPGSDMYFSLMENLGQQFSDCLKSEL